MQHRTIVLTASLALALLFSPGLAQRTVSIIESGTRRSKSSSIRWTIELGYVWGFRDSNEEEEQRKLSDEQLIPEGKTATCSWSGYDCYERSKP
jgi:hypothetical protein